MRLGLKKIRCITKEIYETIRSARNKSSSDSMKLQELRAKNYVATIPKSSWNEMSEALFQSPQDKSLLFIEKLELLKQSCLKHEPQMPKEVEQAFGELERKATVFNERLGYAKAKGKTPLNTDGYGDKFKETNKEYFDIINDYLDKLEVKMCGYSLPYKDIEANREKFKEARKIISKIRTFAYEVFDVSTKDIYNPKITSIADGILGQEQIFYHGTGKALRIKKEGFSLMPSKSQATVAPRELGKGIYMTPDKEVAAYYAGINGSIIHTNIDVKNVAVVNNYQQDMIPETLEKVLDIGLSATFEVEAVVNELFKRNGYDAIYSREALGTGALANPKLIDKFSGGKQSQLVVLESGNIKIHDKTFKQRFENQCLQTKRFVKNLWEVLKMTIFREF